MLVDRDCSSGRTSAPLALPRQRPYPAGGQLSTATTVLCKKLGKELPALTRAPWPGEIGVRIQAEISAEAWDQWKEHAKMLVNEYRLNLGSDEGRTFIAAQMKAFLFDEGTVREAAGFVPKAEGGS